LAKYTNFAWITELMKKNKMSEADKLSTENKGKPKKSGTIMV
jgi:hypothetical protein